MHTHDRALNAVTKKVTIVTEMNTVSENWDLSATLFGKTRRAVLSLLYSHADEAFYLRQIVRTTGVGLGPVQRELKQLSDVGIISRTVQGKQVYYQANRQSPIFNELHGLIVKTAGVVDVLRSALAPSIGRVKVAFIFGSIASGAEGRASDIDLIIIGEVTFADAVSSLPKAEEILQREINSVVYSTAEYKRRVTEKHFFVKEVLEGDKIFVIGNEDELRRLAGE